MGNFNFIKTDIDGVMIIEPKVFGDHRGWFMESYNLKEFQENNINIEFVQDNHSKSTYGVLRGLHFQIQHPQDKLVRVIKGKVYDVAVDLRANSKTFGNYVGVILSEDNKKQFLIPKGFAHGFLVLSNEAEFCYKCSDFYDPSSEGGILWNDQDIHIEWPIASDMTIMLSDKDKKLPTLKKWHEK